MNITKIKAKDLLAYIVKSKFVRTINIGEEKLVDLEILKIKSLKKMGK